MGFDMTLASLTYIRRIAAVPSGRSASGRPPLSLKVYISEMMALPDFMV